MIRKRRSKYRPNPLADPFLNMLDMLVSREEAWEAAVQRLSPKETEKIIESLKPFFLHCVHVAGGKKKGTAA